MKDFVPHDLSAELNNLGFDADDYFGFWNLFDYSNEWKLNTRIQDDSIHYIEAPLYQQAFRFFREKYDLDYSLVPESSSGYKLLDRTYNIVIYKYYVNMNVQAEIVRIDGKIARYNKREEAELECLKKLIEIVKQKQ